MILLEVARLIAQCSDRERQGVATAEEVEVTPHVLASIEPEHAQSAAVETAAAARTTSQRRYTYDRFWLLLEGRTATGELSALLFATEAGRPNDRA